MESAQILEVLFRDSLKGKGISLPNLFKVFYLQFYRIIKRSGKQESSDFAAERLWFLGHIRKKHGIVPKGLDPV